MFDGYLEVNGTEVINTARTKAYVDALLPGVAVKCSEPLVRVALHHNTYDTPRNDLAPWYNPLRPASSRFYGFFTTKMQGASDSSQTISTEELISDGAVHVSPRYEALEIRYVVHALASDEEALEDGIAWLRDVLANDGCREGIGCVGREVRMFTAAPKTSSEAQIRERFFYDVELQEGPKRTQEYSSKNGAIAKIEFTLSVGVPWRFTRLTSVASLAMNSALNFTDPVGENCTVETEAYDNFINDPFFTAIAAPPQPPNVLPPNVIALTSWRRLTAEIYPTLTTRPGRATPVITVQTGSTEAQFIRLRFYEEDAGVSGCDFVGEFLISYLPANSVMTIDARKREITVLLPSGITVPGGHLLYGSAGRPFEWPNMSCHGTYSMTSDMMPGQTGIVVALDVAVRE